MFYYVGMFLRTTKRKNKDGSITRYVQLAHNYRNLKTGNPQAKIIHSFGRKDELDKEALRRLVKSISRFLDPEDALITKAHPGMKIVTSKMLGGTYLLDCLWKRLGIDEVLRDLLDERRYETDIERVIFALTANGALNPTSKLSACDWASEEVHIPGLSQMEVQHAYRAMDFLFEADPEVQREVYSQTANLLNLTVDLIFFDTTSTYFEIEAEDEGDKALRKRGYSKDKRGDLPQVVIGLAVTKEGIPVRCWSWPGNTMDITVIEQVKDDLTGWIPGRVITVLDRGFASEKNLELLTGGEHAYIMAEKMRSGKRHVDEALFSPGDYQQVSESLLVREINVSHKGENIRYVLMFNPKAADRDKKKRDEIVQVVRERLSKAGYEKKGEYTKEQMALIPHKVYGRYIKRKENGDLSINTERIAEDEFLDGKTLIRTSDSKLSPKEVAQGYKQLHQIEDTFKSLKHTLDIRPVNHRKGERIRSHVILRWLSLLLARIAEKETGTAWRNIRREMDRMHLVEFTGSAGRVLQRTETTPSQDKILIALQIDEPPGTCQRF